MNMQFKAFGHKLVFYFLTSKLLSTTKGRKIEKFADKTSCIVLNIYVLNIKMSNY